MCGVFGYVGNKKDAAQIVLSGLKRLEYRGYDSWGVAVVDSTLQKITLKKEVGKIGQAQVDDLASSSPAIGHTRWATHGGVTQANSHPHSSCNQRYAVIHNGIVDNYELLKKKLTKLGHTFVSETDTEVIAHLLEEYAKDMPMADAFKKTFAELDGLNAIVAISVDEKRMFIARNGSPLVLGFGKNEHFVSSDPAALLPLTKEVFFMEDGQMVELTAAEVHVFDSASGLPVSIARQELDWDVSQSLKGEYAHFMLKEIHEQPMILASLATGGVSEARRMAAVLKQSSHTYLVGCGSAAYACLVGTYVLAQVAQFHADWSTGSEFSNQLHFVKKQTAVVALSQSGETMDLLEPLKAVVSKHAKVLALVNVLGSSLYRLADEKFLLQAGPEKAVASTKAFTAKLTFLVLVAYALAGKVDEGVSLLETAVASIRKVLQADSVSDITKIAEVLAPVKQLFVIGRGVSYPASLEIALKIKEITYIHAEGLAAGELKHGTLALIEKDVPCILVMPEDETYTDMVNAAMELKARGAMIIGISSTQHDVFDFFIQVPNAGIATILPEIVAGQLLAYYIALHKDLDPDMPRNLAKSVTVK